MGVVVRDAAVRFRTLVRTQSPVPGSGVGPNLVNPSGPVQTSEPQVSTERASWLLQVGQAGHLVFMHVASNADSMFKTPQRTSPHDMALCARLLSPPSTCLVRTHAPLAEIVADLRTPHPLRCTQLSAPQPTHPPFPHLYAHPPCLPLLMSRAASVLRPNSYSTAPLSTPPPLQQKPTHAWRALQQLCISQRCTRSSCTHSGSASRFAWCTSRIQH